MTGGVLKVWCGAGLGTVHSRPLAVGQGAGFCLLAHGLRAPQDESHHERRCEHAERADRADQVQSANTTL
jgi:hypothetical protein